jgi:SAM-dependent methyltransferase
MVKTKSMDETSHDIQKRVEGFHWWFSVRRKLLKSILSSLALPQGSLALDIGCGTGSNLGLLRAEGLSVIGLDNSFYALSLAKMSSQYFLLNADLNMLPIRPESVGLIIAADIFEHLEDDRNGIHQCSQALTKGGTLIVTVPAFNWLWGIQDLVTRHKRRYRRKDIVNLLILEGFEVLKSSYFNFFLFFPILLARRTTHLLGLDIRSENEINSTLLNLLLKGIFSLEPYLLEHFSFPFGVSILCIARKK